jgi:hypothetical protein
MRPSRGLLVLTMWILLTATCAQAPAAEPAPVTLKVQTVTHRQVDGCLEMTLGKTRLVVVPAWAGRISVLDFGGGNVLWNDPKVDGKILPLGEAWGPWDGNATDVATFIGPERKSQWKGLWLHPWKTISVPGLPTFTAEPGSKAGLSATRTYGPVPPAPKWLEPLTIASEVSPETHLSAERSYALSADGQSLTYTYTLINHGGEARGWTVGERALVPGGGYALAPVQKGGDMPEGWMPRDKTQVAPPELAKAAGDFLVLRAGAKKGAGLAARLRAGWLAGVRGGHALLMTWPIAREGKYPAYSGAHALFWIAEEYLELEPLSAQMLLDEGQSAGFTQVWHWLALPPDVREDDPQAVGKWLEKRAAEMPPM